MLKNLLIELINIEVIKMKICDNCRKILKGKNHIEYDNDIAFCNEDCEDEWNRA